MPAWGPAALPPRGGQVPRGVALKCRTTRWRHGHRPGGSRGHGFTDLSSPFRQFPYWTDSETGSARLKHLLAERGPSPRAPSAGREGPAARGSTLRPLSFPHQLPKHPYCDSHEPVHTNLIYGVQMLARELSAACQVLSERKTAQWAHSLPPRPPKLILSPQGPHGGGAGNLETRPAVPPTTAFQLCGERGTVWEGLALGLALVYSTWAKR